MTSRPPAQRAAGYLIGRACRHLPASTRDERGREWAAELPAILHDPDVRPGWRRSARALRFAAGTVRTARREHGVFHGQLTAADARSAGVRLFGCLGLWLAAVCAVRLGAALSIRPPHGIWIALIVLVSATIDLFAAAQLIKLVRWLCQHD
ncbi:MAG TPA: hypothetical protein VMH35_14430 [Streptosporangiaceae bacterium]|nr:hypothetical protein [Streptosporangiaceae bacterium]